MENYLWKAWLVKVYEWGKLLLLTTLLEFFHSHFNSEYSVYASPNLPMPLPHTFRSPSNQLKVSVQKNGKANFLDASHPLAKW